MMEQKSALSISTTKIFNETFVMKTRTVAAPSSKHIPGLADTEDRSGERRGGVYRDLALLS